MSRADESQIGLNEEDIKKIAEKLHALQNAQVMK